ncbi:cytochrome ubiquinol oxidase subunit I [Streptomyces sp. MUM 203J]|uniref:cytochrome ubiquinol oxidase subunit I n=1 Tax=Streptomyces sp. MUM 203J TaxID=2791990 RepID=UPI001F04384D|nr:cytochrome ubiquinol oxidase subunit I [Streptomyces sp. MUM 203J]MCH0540358.1 cytochrome ubiquinol oxidase subunit I [Streptomyces sp. MUM 203J]
MAFSLGTHIILVPLGVSFPFITLLMHVRGLRRGDAVALQLARRWSVVMAVQFAVGVVTGTVLSLEFGLLWPGLMGRWGDVFGIGFGVEAWAFFLEAVLISVYLYGWRRLKPWTHFWLAAPLPVVALVGAFGILAANSWMNTPGGFALDAEGRPVDVDPRAAVFTPMFGPQYWHFVIAMFMTAGFMVAGVYAMGWLRGRRDRYHRLGFGVPFGVAAVFTPVQLGLGDFIARSLFHQQPVKFAAMELVWNTDTHVPEYVFGRLHPDGSVSGGIRIPSFDSVLAGFSPGTRVTGLTSVPAADRPTPAQATVVHWAFDIMVVIGSLLMLLVLWYAWSWWRRRDLPASRWFFRAAACSGAASVAAVEAGWITTEVGRQPWIVYGNMRVSEAVTPSSASAVWTMFGVVVAVYVCVLAAAVTVLLRMRLRWRLSDEQPDARPVDVAPECMTPYGPPPVLSAGPAKGERAASGAGRGNGGPS